MKFLDPPITPANHYFPPEPTAHRTWKTVVPERFFSMKEKVLDPSRTAFSFAEYMPRSKATERRTWKNWMTYLKELNDVPEAIERRTWSNWTTYLKQLNDVPEGIDWLTWRNWLTYLKELIDLPEGIDWLTWRNWMTYLKDKSPDPSATSDYLIITL